MAIIPLNLRLKKSIHKKIALAQDIVMLRLYEYFPSAVLHGGTAIWRCYGGSRFSEDIDVYLPSKYKSKEMADDFFKYLSSQGFLLKKFKMTDNTIYSKLIYGGVEIRFEAFFKNIKKSVVKPFELSDSTFLNVLTVSPEQLIIEKISAYRKRRKIRDLYDIYFLLKFVTDYAEVKPELKKLSVSLEKPGDEKDLPALIISGAIPDTEKIIKEIRIWAR